MSTAVVPENSLVDQFRSTVGIPRKASGSSWGKTFKALKPLSDGYVACVKVAETTDGLHNIVQGLVGGFTALSGGSFNRAVNVSLRGVDVFIERVKIPQYLGYFFKPVHSQQGFQYDLQTGRYAAVGSGLSFGVGAVAGLAEFLSWLGVADYARISAAIGGVSLCNLSLASFTLGYLLKAIQVGLELEPESQEAQFLNMAASLTEVISKVYLIFLAATLSPVLSAVVGGGLTFIAAGFGAKSVYHDYILKEESEHKGKSGHHHVPPHARAQQLVMNYGKAR